MRRYKYIVAASVLFLSSSTAFAGILNDADIKQLADTTATTYAANVCKNDLPNPSAETCTCLGKAIGTHLQDKDSVTKLKACEKNGYEDCVSAQVAAAKGALTEQEINTCKALTKEASATTPAASNETAATEAKPTASGDEEASTDATTEDTKK